MTAVSRASREKVTALKGLAMLAVVGIHILTSLPAWIYLRAPENFFFIALDQLGRFSVPLFVALSGYGFGSKYASQPLKLWPFLKSQSLKLLPLYFWWSAIFLSVFWFSPTWRAGDNLGSWWQQLIWGRADYHLYFIPMIFSLYLVFPLILALSKRIPAAQMFSASLLIQMAWYWWLGQNLTTQAHPWFISDQHQYLVPLSWIGFFTSGVILALQPEKMVQLTRPLKKFGVILIALTASFLIFRAYSLIEAGVDPLYALRFTKVSVVPYAIAVIGAAILVKSWWQRLPAPLEKKLVWLGSWSFVVYLSHTLFLRILFAILEGKNSISEIVVAGAGLGVGLVGSWVMMTRKM